jgi:predicted ATPase
MLVGRERELETALAACRAADAGRGSVLVVRGEPGIGKTALLETVAAVDPSLLVLRAVGAEAESTVAFATLQSLLWQLRDEIDVLEPRQASLLKGVLDLGPQGSASTFAIGAAALSLLSVASRERATVAIVDDVHWADHASQEVLCFVVAGWSMSASLCSQPCAMTTRAFSRRSTPFFASTSPASTPTPRGRCSSGRSRASSQPASRSS